MRTRRLLWRLYFSYLFITLAALLGVGWLAAASVESFYLGRVAADLQQRAEAIASHVGDSLEFEERGPLEAAMRELDAATNTRFTVALPSGHVIADSRELATNVENL